MKTNRLLVAGVLMAGMCSQALAAEFTLKWLDDFDTAKAAAKAKGLPILASFNGDRLRAGESKKLDREVFSQPAFRQYSTNFVLFVAEYGKGKKQADKVKSQNRDLEDTYMVTGFPTVLLLDAEGNELGRAGYQAGGAEAYVKLLQGLLEKAAKAPPADKNATKGGKTTTKPGKPATPDDALINVF